MNIFISLFGLISILLLVATSIISIFGPIKPAWISFSLGTAFLIGFIGGIISDWFGNPLLSGLILGFLLALMNASSYAPNYRRRKLLKKAQ